MKRSDIEDAFRDVEYPGDSKICECGGFEGEDIKATFRGKRWEEVSTKLFREFPSTLTFFEPEAFHYYLPAYLLHAMSRSADGGEWIASYFAPSRNSHDDEEREDFDRRMKLFDQDQRKVLVEFFGRFSWSDVAKEAVEYLKSIGGSTGDRIGGANRG